MRVLALFASPVLSLLVAPLITLGAASPDPGSIVLVISGWGDASRARVEHAGGALFGPIDAPFGVFAFSDDPDFAANLRAAGAWAIVDGKKLAAICGAQT